MATTKWVSVVLLLILLLSGCESAEQKAQAQTQKAEAQRAQQAAEAARKLHEELGDEMAVAVVHWIAPGEVIEGSGPLPPKVAERFEQGTGFKITNPQMFVKRGTGTLTIVFDCEFYAKDKDLGISEPLIVRLFDENGQYITHFTTEEKFVSPETYVHSAALGLSTASLIKVKAEHNVLQYKINQRDAEYIQKGEFGLYF